MSESNLSDEPSTDHEPATEAPVVAGAGVTFDALDSTSPLDAEAERSGAGGAADPDGSAADE
jgi:hypothetical protein